MEIRHKSENRNIVEGEYVSFIHAVEMNKRDLQGANLQGADLRDAKIKITQTETLSKSLGIIVEE